MKILQVITLSDLGGAQSVVINLANKLCKEHEVYIIAGDGDGKMWDLLDNHIVQIPIRSLKRKISFFNELRTLIAFIWFYRKIEPDIIHLHSSKVGILGRIAFPKSKVVYTVHGFDSIRIAHRQYLPVEKILQKRCHSIVGVSEYDRNNLLKEGVKNNVITIYNGVHRPFSLTNDPFDKLEGYSRKILCIARISPQKNLNLFIEIATLLPSYAFIWIGNQQEYNLPHPQNVFFMGNLSNAGAYNEFVDLFILTSNYEGLPMTIIEAMALGKPVVASNVGGISEIVINGENGYTVENVPGLFIEKIKYILENRDVYALFSQNSERIYIEKLTVDKMVNGYLKLYNV